MNDQDRSKLLELTAEIVGAYVASNPLPVANLIDLIASTSAALRGLSAPPAAPVQSPARNPKRSVFPDYIISLEDGRRFKSLKRPLMTRHGLTPDEYRTKWGLPLDYPMVAPNYASARSELAKKMGLGRKPSKALAKQSKPAKKELLHRMQVANGGGALRAK